MKKKIFLPFYEKCMQDGRMKYDGLCSNFDGLCCDNGMDTLDLFNPTDQDSLKLLEEGLSTTYWGSGLPDFDFGVMHGFTPLRQTIVLFMAAINNEL